MIRRKQAWRWRGLALAAACLLAPVRAEVFLGTPFVDHAVLQRDLPVPIWGRARPGERVEVSFASQRVSTTADSQGRWRVTLLPLEANATGTDLVVSGDNRLTVRDVVVGEVWLCSGQSNMEQPVSETLDAAQEIASAAYPLIRHLKVRTAVAAEPVDAAAVSGWESATPRTVGRFTGLGYYFARQIHSDLGGVPVGIINASLGSTPIEAWMDASSLAGDPAFDVVYRRWEKVLADFPEKQAEYLARLTEWNKADAIARGESAETYRGWQRSNPRPAGPPGPGHRWTPEGLFNGMINPLVPYAVRGVLWYQGERNAADDRVGEYHALFKAMIDGWRARFGRDDLPFFWVNLPNLIQTEPTGRRWAFLREAQTRTLVVPHTAQAVTIDIGDPRNIHPANKQGVAARLALLARNRVYALSCEDTGPTFLDARIEGRALRVRFSHASGLHARGDDVRALELAGVDGEFHPAEARLEGDEMLVYSATVSSPVAVRYAFTNAPHANLYNGAGLPAVPFRSDQW